MYIHNPIFMSVSISAGVWATKGTGNYQVIEKNTDKRSRYSVVFVTFSFAQSFFSFSATHAALKTEVIMIIVL